MNRMPNGHEMLTPDTSPDATAPFRGPYEGEIWYNKNLAATFCEVAANGKDGYYKGRIAKEIVKVLGDMGGVMTEEDLANHYVRCVLHAAARYTRGGPSETTLHAALQHTRLPACLCLCCCGLTCCGLTCCGLTCCGHVIVIMMIIIAMHRRHSPRRSLPTTVV